MEDDAMRNDLPPGTDPSEVRELAAMAQRLRAERPAPAPRFRGELGRQLVGAQSQRGTTLLQPRRALALSGCYSLAGLLLLAIAAAGLSGAGPFAPS